MSHKLWPLCVSLGFWNHFWISSSSSISSSHALRGPTQKLFSDHDLVTFLTSAIQTADTYSFELIYSCKHSFLLCFSSGPLSFLHYIPYCNLFLFSYCLEFGHWETWMYSQYKIHSMNYTILDYGLYSIVYTVWFIPVFEPLDEFRLIFAV